MIVCFLRYSIDSPSIKEDERGNYASEEPHRPPGIPHVFIFLNVKGVLDECLDTEVLDIYIYLFLCH